MSLFGDAFDIKIKEPPIKDLIKKATTKKEVDLKELDPEKLLKSKKLSLMDRLQLIKVNVLKILGKQRNNVLVIKDIDTFRHYIDKAFLAGRIAIDTETNNSLDPITCKLMGLCLYIPGEKQAYVPINHTDLQGIRLAWQLTESDCAEQLNRLIAYKNIWRPDFLGQSYYDWWHKHPEILNKDKAPLIIMHNGKFDYEVIKCTCNVAIKPDWDTIIAARLLNENEKAGLKDQYIAKIDPLQAKYDIEKLFEHISYAFVEPEIFALYAATDSMMTDKLYELQSIEFNKPEYGPHKDLTGKHDVNGLRWLFHNVEMPIVIVTAEMELTGVCIDTDFGEKLKEKYTAQLTALDSAINAEMDNIKPIIVNWKTNPKSGATDKTKIYVPKKTKMSLEKIEAQYPNIDKNGDRYKVGKAKIEQLEDPINLASPTQLAILFYDILGVAPVSKKNPRGTGKAEMELLGKALNVSQEALEADAPEEDELEDVDEVKQEDLADAAKQAAAKLCELILKRRGIMKLVTTYIDVIPDLAKHWPDGRIRFHLNSLGTDTGRYSSGGKIKYLDENNESIEVSGINIQNIPSHNKEIRMLFKAATKNHTVEIADDSYYTVPETDEVETTNGWKLCKDLIIGDQLIGDNNVEIITNILKQENKYLLYV